MSLRKTSSKIALLIVLIYVLLTCGFTNGYLFKYFNDCHPTADKFLTTLYSTENSQIKQQFDLISDFTDAHVRSFSEVMQKEGFLAIEKLECVGYGYRTENNIYFANYFINFKGGEKLYSEVVFQRDSLEARAPRLLGIHSFQKESMIERFEGWTSDVGSNSWLLFGVICFLSSLFIAVLIVKDHSSNWILWLVASQIGIGLFQLDMTAGGFAYQLVNIGFPILTYAKTEITPWGVTFMLPIFSWIYVLVRFLRKKA